MNSMIFSRTVSAEYPELLNFLMGISRFQSFISYKFFSSRITFYRTISYKKYNCDIPCAKHIPLLGNIIPVELIMNGGGQKLHEFIDTRHKLLGPIFREHLGPITSIFVCDVSDIRKIFANEGKCPKHVLPESWLLYNKIKNYKRGIYFMDGEEWFHCRKMLNPLLLKDFYFTQQVDDFLTKYFEAWNQHLNDGEIMDLEKRLYNISIIFMILYLMGDSFIAQAKLFIPLADKLASVVGEIFYWSVQLSTVPASLANMCGFNSWKRFVASVDESIRISSDLLDLIIHLGSGNGIIRDMIDDGIPKELMRNIVVDFILAAGDTTATSSQWILYLLGTNRAIQNEIFLQLKNQEDYRKVPLLKNSIRESMRLYPVAPFITRYLPHDTHVGAYTIRAGELVSMSMYTCSRNEKYFPEPNKFYPDRWIRLMENGQYKMMADPYATLPYGLGNRACIGQKMAHTQLIMTIGKIISIYELQAMNEVGVKMNLITVPSIPIRLRIKQRS